MSYIRFFYKPRRSMTSYGTILDVLRERLSGEEMVHESLCWFDSPKAEAFMLFLDYQRLGVRDDDQDYEVALRIVGAKEV
jgi:hypothetical protein